MRPSTANTYYINRKTGWVFGGAWACRSRRGVLGLGLRFTAWLEGFGFLVVEPWVSAWAWVTAWCRGSRLGLGFTAWWLGLSLGFGARRGGWAWVDGVVVGRVWVFGGGAVGLGLGLGSPAITTAHNPPHGHGLKQMPTPRTARTTPA
uniref:Uncharacterized protein n=1 Tax=Fagus sylvatica TaxID=28930 RepID=A0A2N9G4Y3_FAGSY